MKTQIPGLPLGIFLYRLAIAGTTTDDTRQIRGLIS